MTEKKAEKNATKDEAQKTAPDKKATLKEIGGPSGLEPTRYGDWERKGIVSDF